MSVNNPDRRAVLRGMLAVLCAMCLPKALWGAGMPAAVTQPSQAKGSQGKGGQAKSGEATSGQKSGQTKMSKVRAKYQEKPKGDQKCSNCLNFVAPASCKLVEGKISPDGWCMLWVKKQA